MARPTARALWHVLEPIHAVTYFCPEPLDALTEAGYRGFWMGYFAGRAAPFGEASAELVDATFYNFTPERVRRALPSAWEYAPPAAALEARLAGSVHALTRITADASYDNLPMAVDLALRAAMAAPLHGCPLYAANRALPVPEGLLEQLWHACTLLREHRGDGHVAALLAEGIGGRESHVLHALSIGMPPSLYSYSRDFGPEEWASCVASLQARGLANTTGLTVHGEAVKARIEERTDAAAEEAYAALTDAQLTTLRAALRPITLAVAGCGDLPQQTPIGLDLGEI